MTARLILTHPDSRLRIRSQDVTEEEMEKELATWCQDLHDTMVANAGLGLAAPQIGLHKRIFAVDAKDLENPNLLDQISQNGSLFFVNPNIDLVAKSNANSLEACLSVPNTQYSVKRSPIIDLSYTTPDKRNVAVRVVGKDAVVLQHEYDHLNGKLFIDRLNPFDRKEFNKRFEKPKREKSEEEIKHLREQKRARSRAKRKK